MPKTAQEPIDRRTYNYGRARKDSAKILDESPDSETKAQMKARDAARWRVMQGDNDILTGAYYAKKPSGNPDMKKGGKVRGDGCCIKGKTKGRFI